MYYATECGCPLESVEFIVLKALVWTNRHYLMAIFQINLGELVAPLPYIFHLYSYIVHALGTGLHFSYS